MTVQLGETYTDKISGWKGTATGVYNFLNGCQRVTLAGEKDGKPEEFTFDVQQLVDLEGRPADDDAVIDGNRLTSKLNRLLQRKTTPAEMAKARVGGPRPTPSRSGL